MKRILHICLSSSYTPNLNYQENYFVDKNLKDNYKVFVLSNNREIINGKFVKAEECEKEIENQIGKRVERDRDME